MREQQEKCQRALPQAPGDDPVKGDGCQEDGARWVLSVVPRMAQEERGRN